MMRPTTPYIWYNRLGKMMFYVTRGDSIEGLDSIGASGSSNRHLPEGAEALRGSSRGISSPRSDEKAECKYRIIITGPLISECQAQITLFDIKQEFPLAMEYLEKREKFFNLGKSQRIPGKVGKY